MALTSPQRTYGEIAYSKPSDIWTITKLEPHVSIRLKDIFSCIKKTETKRYKLQNTPIITADIKWFMSRYPLRISKSDRVKLLKGARQFKKSQSELERILLPDQSLPAIHGLNPGEEVRYYQQQAIELLRRRKHLLCGDVGGLGKTYTAAGFLCAEPGALPAMCVVDPHMQKQWFDKVTHFTTLSVHKIKGTRPYDLPPADLYVFKVSQIAGWVDIFQTGFFKAVVYDEPQSLRTGLATAKGQAANIITENTIYHLGLTATPIYNYGDEIWNVMYFIDKTVLGPWHEFIREWCTGFGNGRYRVKDPKALGTYLREQYAMIRRTKKDVGKETPDVSRPVEYVDYDKNTVKSVEDLATQLAIRATTSSFMERGKASRELDLMMRKNTGVAKAHAVAKFVRMLIEGGEPVLLSGWHRDVYDIWLKELKDFNPAMHTGSETAAKKEKEKQRFLSGETDLIIMSLRSTAGVDELQHRCSTLVFGELDWSPGIHQQVIWRVDREGQPYPVTAFFLVTDNGSDPVIMEVLGIKSSEATQIVDPYDGITEVVTSDSNLKRLVDNYIKQKGIDINKYKQQNIIDLKTPSLVDV